MQYDSATEIAGQTWDRIYVVIDDAHWFTRGQVDMLIGRVGIGTKIVILGDPSQIESAKHKTRKYLDEKNNGLVHAIEDYMGRPRYGHVTLSIGCVQRSEIAGYVGT